MFNKDIVYFITRDMYSMVYGLISSAILFGTLTCCSTNCSISIEGKQFYLLKSLPLSVKDIFIAKIMVNLLILIPTCTVALLLVAFVFNIDLVLLILYFVEIVVCSLFISIFGLILNLHFYRFDYDNPVYVIKQSVPVFITVFGSVIIAFGVMFISLFLNLEAKLMISFIDMIFIVLNLIQFIYLKKRGKDLFLKING